jgi:hypothetical protein
MGHVFFIYYASRAQGKILFDMNKKMRNFFYDKKNITFAGNFKT